MDNYLIIKKLKILLNSIIEKVFFIQFGKKILILMNQESQTINLRDEFNLNDYRSDQIEIELSHHPSIHFRFSKYIDIHKEFNVDMRTIILKKKLSKT